MQNLSLHSNTMQLFNNKLKTSCTVLSGNVQGKQLLTIEVLIELVIVKFGQVLPSSVVSLVQKRHVNISVVVLSVIILFVIIFFLRTRRLLKRYYTLLCFSHLHPFQYLCGLSINISLCYSYIVIQGLFIDACEAIGVFIETLIILRKRFIGYQ